VNEHLSDAMAHAYRNNWLSTYDWAGAQVRRQVSQYDPLDIRILDVGAGQGKYRVLLADYPQMDAIEIFEPYIEEHRLHELYDTVYIGDAAYVVTQFPDGTHWDVVIFGDVLEHLDLERAQQMLLDFERVCTEYYVIVPYDYPQGEEDGNIHQRHLQDTLTPAKMVFQYPQLSLVAVESTVDGTPFKGLYKRRTNS